MLFFLLACQPEPAAEPVDKPCDTPDETFVVMLKTISFARRDEEGHTVGFDLDNRVSDATDSAGCNKEDLVSPDGTPGIDSAFSALVPVMEKTEAAAVEGLIQDAINSGELLVGAELEDLDSLEKDECVNLNVVRAVGPPMLGTDGYIEAGQTYDRDADVESVHLENVTVEGGAVTAGPFTWSMPLQVLDAQVNLILRDSYLHFSVAENGVGSGYIGGGIEVSEIVTFLGGIGSDVGDILDPLLVAAADLKPNEAGTCDQMSAVIEFQTTSGFFFED